MIFEPNKKAVGKRIRDIRVGRNETMEDFAIEINSNKSNVSRWERGINLPNAITLNKIAELEGISADELLYGSSYAVEHPSEYRFIRKNLKEVYLSYEKHEKIANKIDDVNLDLEVESYLFIYANDFSTSPLFKQSIATKDSSLFKSLLKNDIEDKLFFSDKELGYIREVTYNLYELSNLLGNIRGRYEQEYDCLPPHSKEISEILNKALSEIVELLEENEINKILSKVYDYNRNLKSDFDIFKYQEED